MGQWTDEGSARRTGVAGTYDRCHLRGAAGKDEELCWIARSPICWGLAKERYAAYTRNNYLPALRF